MIIKKYFKISALIIFALIGAFFYLLSTDAINFFDKPQTTKSPEQPQQDKENSRQNTPATSTADTSANSENNEMPPFVEADPAPPKKNILFIVPFTSQAPFGEWSEVSQHDGCEEASALMAVQWARGESLTKEEAKAEIISASNYEQSQIGEFRDTSAEDTMEIIIKGYFQYQNVEIKNAGSVEDIVRELESGNLVIVPANGRALGNPNYTAPGPERHMLVIRGYDYTQKEFITNDSGTRKGEGYRYPESIVFNAIRDYLTGHDLPIINTIKTMIIISKL